MAWKDLSNEDRRRAAVFFYDQYPDDNHEVDYDCPMHDGNYFVSDGEAQIFMTDLDSHRDPRVMNFRTSRDERGVLIAKIARWRFDLGGGHVFDALTQKDGSLLHWACVIYYRLAPCVVTDEKPSINLRQGEIPLNLLGFKDDDEAITILTAIATELKDRGHPVAKITSEGDFKFTWNPWDILKQEVVSSLWGSEDKYRWNPPDVPESEPEPLVSEGEVDYRSSVVAFLRDKGGETTRGELHDYLKTLNTHIRPYLMVRRFVDSGFLSVEFWGNAARDDLLVLT